MDSDRSLEKELGRGRSGIVFQRNSKAIKVFNAGGLLEKLVNYALTGAPCAYGWSEDAVQSAYYRRNILSELVEYWFDSKLSVAKAHGIGWNNDFLAYELQTELINGRHAALHHPFSEQREFELSDLVHNIMNPLQEKLIESGFDGLVWQAGLGNPTASSNFLLENGNNNSYKWAWIDLESGVPAVAPLNPISIFSFYLPKSIKHKHALFDDVDVGKLREYMEIHKIDLETKIGSGRLKILTNNINMLEEHQKIWKSMNRADKSITYQLKKEKITQEQADWYSNHPILWYGREFVRVSWKSYNKLLGDLPWDIFTKVVLNYEEALSKAWKFIYSEEYRTQVVRDYILNRITSWEKRHQIKPDEADYLRNRLEDEIKVYYLKHFGRHIATKIPAKAVQLAVLPALYGFGVIDEWTLAKGEFWVGAIARETYTSIKLSQAISKLENPNEYFGRKILDIEHFIAFSTAWIPSFGNFAYLVEGLYTPSVKDKSLTKFILYDFFSRLGEKFPLWGGKDTLIEHYSNHALDLIVRSRKELNSTWKASSINN